MGQVLFLAGLAALPLLLLRAALRSILRAITTRLRLIVRIARDPVVFAPQLADAVARLPRGVGSKAARSLRVWALAAQVPLPAADLASSSAPEPAPDLEPAPNPGPSPELPAGPLDPAPPFRKLAKFANAEVPVLGWLIPIPSSRGSSLLAGPRAVLFPDAIPYLMPLGWADEFSQPEAGFPLWRAFTKRTLEEATTIITFSEHIKRVQGPKFFPPGVPVVVAPPAPPDLSALLPGAASRRAAAAVLRRHAATRAWRYLADFPFEDVTYVAVSNSGPSYEKRAIDCWRTGTVDSPALCGLQDPDDHTAAAQRRSDRSAADGVGCRPRSGRSLDARSPARCACGALSLRSAGRSRVLPGGHRGHVALLRSSQRRHAMSDGRWTARERIAEAACIARHCVRSIRR